MVRLIEQGPVGRVRPILVVRPEQAGLTLSLPKQHNGETLFLWELNPPCTSQAQPWLLIQLVGP